MKGTEHNLTGDKKMTTGKEAIAIMIKECTNKRRGQCDEIERVKKELASMRSNARNRQEREQYLANLQTFLKNTEATIHSLDSFDVVIEDYEILQKEIAVLCDKRRALFSDPVLESSLVTTKRNGFYCA
jgi:hypothetical protein